MKKTISTLITCGFLSAASANNITVTNSSLSGQNTIANTILINFDVAWENSWRTYNNENNRDGAWVFVKFKKNGAQNWEHCTINGAGTAGTGATIEVPADSMGAFIYSNAIANFIGNVNYMGNQLVWNYGVDNVLDNDSVEIKVFALEMVYIPTGNYYLGSGGSEGNSYRDGNTINSYHVTSGGAIIIGTTPGTLSFNGNGSGDTIPATFPNGFNAFWIMKYECSQQQYADFLNNVTLAQATTLTFYGTGNFTGSWPNFIPVVAERANNNLYTTENAAFADWAGLRPMSEMEFEKACRGANITPVADEYAWGSTSIQPLLTVTNAGQPNESVNTPANANAVIGLSAPFRVGIFARPSASTRQLSGATYYGVMNMSDNLRESTIYAGNIQGQSINSSVHGDGVLAANGNTNEPSWVSAAFGLRGGAYSMNTTSDLIFCAVSFRGHAHGPALTSNWIQKGIRLVRTAP